MMKNYKRSYGFTLIEIMVAMLIGVIIMAGALSMHSGTRTTQKANEAQMDMVADARFAIEMISHDLRHAGMWGGTNKDGVITCKSTDDSCSATPGGVILPTSVTVSRDCADSGNPVWAFDLAAPVFGTDDVTGNPYGSTCLNGEGYKADTDILEIKYADSNEPIALLAGQAYIRSNFENGQIFIGTTQPVISRRDATADTKNHVLHAFAYYISTDTDASDGIPSLRRASLVNGPEIQNQILVSGVVDLQIQFGEDVIEDDVQAVSRYVNADDVVDWRKVYAVKVWLLMRSNEKQKGVGKAKTFKLAGVSGTYGGADDYRYFMVTSTINLRNVKPLI